jgi:Protein of unknown function (DUF3570)
MPARRALQETAARPEADVAATEADRRRPRAPKRRLADLPWIAAGVGALAARDARGQSTADAQFLFYKESGGRTQVIDPVVLVRQDLGESYGHLGILLGYDSISGASPTGAYPSADVTTSASGHTTSAGNFPQSSYKDARKSASLSWDKRFGAHLPSIDVSYAKENDYVARGFGLSDAWTVLHGLGTIHFGVAFSRDLVQPVKNPITNPLGEGLSYPKSENGYSLGYTWILGERDLLDVSGSLMQLSGYLNDPYKVVTIGAPSSNQTAPEQRPDTRSRRALVLKYGHHYLWDGAVRVTYRYYNDTWGVQAHTIEVTYDQRIDADWMVSPQVRFYTQSAASFYVNLAPSPLPLMSADYRLSPFDSILGGLMLTYKVAPSLSINGGFTAQSQRGRDRVLPVPTTPGGLRGSSTVSSADLNVLTITLGLSKTY